VLEDVRQMLQNNELIKRQNLRRKPQDWLSRAKGGDQRVGNPKGIQELLTVSLATFARNQGTSRKIV